VNVLVNMLLMVRTEAEGVKAGLSSPAMKEAVRRVAPPEPRP
jgi:hypothetical protein